MTVLVTGGAGFIGSHIVEALIKEGHRVRVLDNFSTGNRKNIPNGVEVFEASITDPKAIAPAFIGVQYVFHTAALPRVQLSIEKPEETNEANITGTLNVLRAAALAGVKRVIYSASSSAYGDQDTLPLHEEMKPNPKSPYGLQKYVGEHYCKMASMFWGVETVALRYFNVFGPRLALEGGYVTVIAVFLKQLKKGEDMTITGDGTQTRDFTYVDDVVNANLSAMKSDKAGKGEVINIGAGNNRSVNEIAKLMGGMWALPKYIEARIEPRDTLANIKKAKELIDWEPKAKFEDGLKKTIEWFKKEYG